MAKNSAGKNRADRTKVLALLLECKSINEVAKASGVSRTTIDRWLKEDDFKADLRDAQKDLLQHVIRRLAKLSGNAVEVLEKTMGDEGATVSEKLRAAQIALDSMLKINEQVTLAERIEELEGRFAE